jgi:hypothetical protein
MQTYQRYLSSHTSFLGQSAVIDILRGPGADAAGASLLHRLAASRGGQAHQLGSTPPLLGRGRKAPKLVRRGIGVEEGRPPWGWYTLWLRQRAAPVPRYAND